MHVLPSGPDEHTDEDLETGLAGGVDLYSGSERRGEPAAGAGAFSSAIVLDVLRFFDGVFWSGESRVLPRQDERRVRGWSESGYAGPP